MGECGREGPQQEHHRQGGQVCALEGEVRTHEAPGEAGAAGQADRGAVPSRGGPRNPFCLQRTSTGGL